MKALSLAKLREALAGSPLLAALETLLAGARATWRGLSFAGRVVWKIIITVWRLFGALDQALWRGVRVFLASAGKWLGAGAGAFGRASRDLLDWLPSRSGRAYTAFSGLVLVVALLWIVDELRGSASRAEVVLSDGALTAPVDFNDPILARIDGRYVHLSEVASAARAAGALQPGEELTPADAFKRDLVRSYVEQRLLARAATEAGLHKDADVNRRLSAARDRILAGAFMEERVSGAVTDEAVRKLYERNVDATRLGEAVKCRHIVVATEEEAREILTAIEAGADFAELARTRSLDRSTGPQGGETGYLTRQQMTPVFADAAFSTPQGGVAPLFFTEHGWNILQIVDRRKSGGVPYAQVKDGIRRFLELKTVERAVADLRDESDVVYYPVEAPPEVPGPPPLRTEDATGG